MKLTKKQLKKIIKEELESIMGSGPRRIEDLEFTRGEKIKMMVQSHHADGAVATFSKPEHFEAWKAKVVKRYPRSAASLERSRDRFSVWMPASGPWKDAYDANMGEKARSIGKHGSH